MKAHPTNLSAAEDAMANYTVQLTAPAGVYPFNTVRVSLTCAGQPQQIQNMILTPNVAVSHVFDIANGTWDLEISGAGFVPVNEPNIVVNGNALNPKNLDVVWYTLHTDRNRDGILDDAGLLNQVTPAAITYGTAGIGAIIPVNCNRDGNNTARGYADNQDQRVNGNNDLVTGTSRLEIRRNALGPNAVAPVVPVGWSLLLTVIGTLGENPARQHLRIFNGILNNSTEIIGPETTDNVPIATASIGASKLYALEAVRFAGNGFTSGQIRIALHVIQPEVTGIGNPTYLYADRVVVARWIGNHHLQEVTRMYVANANNAQFRLDLGAAAAADNPVIPVTVGAPITATPTAVPYLNGNVWAPYLGGVLPAGDDRWMRDTIVSGHCAWPGNGAGVENKDVFMKTHRWRHLQNWVYETLISANVGVSYPAAGSADGITSANSGGNIAVTPPVQKTVNGAVTPYRYGRIYYGHNRYHTVDASSRNFMAAQNMQAPIILDTDWLEVGHVDEMLTFIPDNNPASAFKKWKLLVASPAEAYRLMTNAQRAHGGARVLNRAVWNIGTNSFDYASLQIRETQWDNVNARYHRVGVDVGATINDFLGNGQAPLLNPRNVRARLRYTYQQLRNWNVNGVEVIINRNVNLLKQAFDLDDTDIIKVPVIFFPESYNDGDFTFADKVSGWTIGRDNGFNVYPGKQGGFQCGALTGDMPNMFVGNDRLMIPKPFGPWIEDNTNPHHGYDLFERDLDGKVRAIVGGPTCEFIDDWDDYHVALGEIHCGTNELRDRYDGQTAFGNARYANWWTAVDA
ncbi:hypothetical protein AUQ42_01690 [Thalassospira sp. MCCC 1A02491]|nr:hypothetical protein AUQ42_01690 [Thalassospira sp. MCCC 1A02491]